MLRKTLPANIQKSSAGGSKFKHVSQSFPSGRVVLYVYWRGTDRVSCIPLVDLKLTIQTRITLNIQIAFCFHILHTRMTNKIVFKQFPY